MKKRDVPHDLRPIYDAMMKVCNHRHPIHTVFSDFLDMVILTFTVGGEKEHRWGCDYSERELEALAEMRNVYFANQAKLVGDGWKWYDQLGDFYMELSSYSSQKYFGQFFTPPEICDLMAGIKIPEAPGHDVTVSDCAVGSGRTLLAAHCRLKGRGIMYGEDLDGICARMTVVNLLVHGVRGEVVHHDTLNPEMFYGGWHVNWAMPRWNVAHVRPIDREESRVWRMWKQEKLQNQTQLTLF